MSTPGDTVLATYGTLSPGRSNHHQLDGLAGTWSTGSVRGRLMPEGWGAALGYPGLILDPNGAPVPLHIFHSDDLPAHWARLDEFEGEGYARTPVEVETGDGMIIAMIYLLAEHP
ncbi:MAG: gamma-glutamylcyclotransferase [Phyllobacteriaceae bacterium]|nr:gamma-glutamylcyclotransferase [Phyllobacteriaceae bacterium]